MASSPGRRRALLAVAFACSPARAQADMQVELLSTGLYLIRGGGGNSLLRFSGNGLVLVNGKSPESYKPLMRQIRRLNKLADMPLRALLLTDVGQAGDSAAFAAARVATIAQAEAARQLRGGGNEAVVSFEDDYTLRMGGVEMRMLHVGPASSGRSLVWLADKKTVAVGQADAAGWRAALALEAGLFVPNDGPPLDRAGATAQANFSA